jgi:hypothetical protein
VLLGGSVALIALGAFLALIAPTLSTSDGNTAVTRARYVDPPKGGPIPKSTDLLYVRGRAHVHPIRSGFLGLSLEYPAVESYAGANPLALNPVFLQLIRNLTPFQAPVIRIGGDSTDRTWWPVQGVHQPIGVRYSLSWSWLQVLRSLTQQLGGRLILGVNLEAKASKLLGSEAFAFLSTLPRNSILALEPGNEPELYRSWTYYRTPRGRKITGRPADYTFGGFEQEFSAVQRALGRTPLAGPTLGSLKWSAYLHGFLAREPRLALVTLHRYPLQLCYIAPSSPRYPTLAHLLSPFATRDVAAGLSSAVALAHKRGLAIRIDEMNTNGCGHDRGLSDTFASALWSLDTLFALAHQGVDGVNVHTYPGASYELFRMANGAAVGGRPGQAHGWTAKVQPEYYGLLMFADSAPPGSQPLQLAGPATRDLSTWATRGTDGRTRVVLINETSRRRTIAIHGLFGNGGPASLVRLIAPRATARAGITLAGLSFGTCTSTGRLSGHPRLDWLRPNRGSYVVGMPAMSAALVTLP